MIKLILVYLISLSKGNIEVLHIKGKIPGDSLEKYVVLDEKIKKQDLKWSYGIFEGYITKRKNKIIKVEVQIKGFGISRKFLIPPGFYNLKSNGKLEREIKEGKIKYQIVEENNESKNKRIIKNEFNWVHKDVIIEESDWASQNEISLSLGSGNNIYVAWNDYRGPNGVALGFTYSHSGGLVWDSTKFIGLEVGGFPEQGDPVVFAISPETVYVCVLSFDRYDWTSDIWVYRSTDGGITFPDSGLASPNTPSSFEDKPWIYARGDTVWCVYASIGGGGIKLSKSTNGGRNFYVLSTVSSYGNGAIPLVDLNGNIYVIWNTSLTGGYISCKKSTDGGYNWSSQITIGYADYNENALPWRHYPLPGADIDLNNGHIYVVWHSYSASTGYDIYFSKSTNGGISFTSPIKINHITYGHQTMPWISADENGILHVFWYHTPYGDSTLSVYYSYSTDYGQTWAYEELVRDTMTPGRIDFIGDYINIDTKENKVFLGYCFRKSASSDNDDAWVSFTTFSEIAEKQNFLTKRKTQTQFYGIYNIIGKKVSNPEKPGIYFKFDKKTKRIRKILKIK